MYTEFIVAVHSKDSRHIVVAPVIFKDKGALLSQQVGVHVAAKSGLLIWYRSTWRPSRGCRQRRLLLFLNHQPLFFDPPDAHKPLRHTSCCF